jgi:hypothetical protein
MLTRPLPKYVVDYLMATSRKSKTPMMSTTKLMFGKMAGLMMIVTIPQQQDMMIETAETATATALSPKSLTTASSAHVAAVHLTNRSCRAHTLV